MKFPVLIMGLLVTLTVSCSIREMGFSSLNLLTSDVFYAKFEAVDKEPETKVFTAEDLFIRWNADDRITVFNKSTYNQEYCFSGETGDNSGTFKLADNGDFMTGNALENIYAIYPYLESTKISDTGIITVALPAEQKYAENSFGLNANTMISATTDNQLMFKNVGGYLMLKLYGDDVTISSISLNGNNGEKLSGKSLIDMPIDGIPSVEMADDAGNEITIVCDTPVKIGTTIESATVFWMAIPPTSFSKGFTLTVKDNKNGVYKKSTAKSIEIGRNKLARMTALKVEPALSDEAIVFADQKLKERLVAKFDTDGDGELSYKEAAAVTSIEGAVTIKTITSFDEFQFFTSVTSIPKDCFKDWNKLTSIILPTNVKVINESAFENCSVLSSVILSPSLTTIHSAAFKNCDKLAAIILPETLQSVGSLAFMNCSTLDHVILPDGLRSIGYGVFYGCASLTSIIVPDSVNVLSEYHDTYNEIHYGVFENCSSLQFVQLGNHITRIPKFVFFNCPRLNSITFSSSITTIDYGAFYGCSSLADFPLPECLESINGYLHVGQYGEITHYGAFEKCISLRQIMVPSKLKTIGPYSFCGSEQLSNISFGSVQEIGQFSFSECSSLMRVCIPETVSHLGSGAFANCTGLESIILPESISRIQDRTFSGCTSLSSFCIPESVTSIGYGAFYNCKSLETIVIPDSVIRLEMYLDEGYQAHMGVFEGCSGLKSVQLGKGLTALERSTFQDCSCLETILIPNTITRIYSGVFKNCSSLKTITIPDSISGVLGYHIDSVEGVFEGCSSLTDIVLSNNLEIIGNSCFKNCSSLESIRIPNSIKEIGYLVFGDCVKLSDIIIPNGVESIGGRVFENCTSLKKLTLPQTIQDIGSSAFKNCI